MNTTFRDDMSLSDDTRSLFSDDEEINERDSVNIFQETIYDGDQEGNLNEEVYDEEDDDREAEKTISGTDAVGSYELDEDYSIPNDGDDCNRQKGALNSCEGHNGNMSPLSQREGESDRENAEDDREHDEQFQEDMEEWQALELKRLAQQIEKKLEKIVDFEKRKSSLEQIIKAKEEEHERKYQERDMGANDLQKILSEKEEKEKILEEKVFKIASVNDWISHLRNQVAETNTNPLPRYIKHLKNEKKKQLRQKKDENDLFQDLDEGDDSLSDKPGWEETKRINAVQACRRCKYMKVACKLGSGKQCENCMQKGRRCRFRGFPFAPGRQLRPYQVEEMDRELQNVKAMLACYQESSRSSLLADNPLSGITGYGPHPSTFARQNFARMNRGLSPVISPFPGLEQGCIVGQGKRKERSETDENQCSQQVKRQKTIAPQFINQTLSVKPGQTSAEQKTGERKESQYPQVQPPRFDAIPVNSMQEWWARQLLRMERGMPVGKDNRPVWPDWTLSANYKKQIWFRSFDSHIRVPLLATTGNEVTLIQPEWPGWTMLDENLSEHQKSFLEQQLKKGREICELRNQDGVGERKIDWKFYEVI